MVDREVTTRLLRILADNVESLRRYEAAHGRDAIARDADLLNMVAYAMYKAIQASIDLALHWASDAALPGAETYADAFLQLGRAGKIDAALAARLVGWAGLRNVLAHLYAELDPDRLVRALSELDDLEAFAAAVSRE